MLLIVQLKSIAMLHTDEEKAAFEAATVKMKPVRKLLRYWLLVVIFPPAAILGLPMAIGYLPLTAYYLYKANPQRIAQGKTSFTVAWPGFSPRASHNHLENQASNALYMVVGGLISLSVVLSPLIWFQ